MASQFSATFPLKLLGAGTAAPFTSVGTVGGARDADNVGSRYSTVAAQTWYEQFTEPQQTSANLHSSQHLHHLAPGTGSSARATSSWRSSC